MADPRHGHRRAARLPDRLLHGPGRLAAHARDARRRRADAALGGLPRQGLRLADRSSRATASSSGCSARSASRRPGLDELAQRLARLQLPVAAVHDPADLRRAGADPDLTARGIVRPRRAAAGTTFRRVVLPLVFPALVAGSIFTFSLTLGDYITPDLVADAKFIGNVIYDNSSLGNLPARGRLLAGADRDHDRLPARRQAPRRLRVAVRAGDDERCVRPDPAAPRDGARPGVPVPAARHPRDLRVQPEPDPGLAADRLHAPLVRRGDRATRASCQALVNSLIVATVATAIALVLGTLASLAVQRYAFFGRETISFLLVLPIALPGVVTGIALAHVVRDVRHRVRPAHDHRRPRHVLRGHRLQQRHRPAAPAATVARGGVGRPRRRRVHDVPPRDAARHGHGPAVRRRCSRSPCRSTRSSSRTSRRAPGRRPCRCGSLPPSSARSSCRSSTSSRSS